MSDLVGRVRKAAERVRERLPEAPSVGLILGSGLSRVADELADSVEIPYGEIPGCPVPTVPGHPGKLCVGLLAGRRVAALVGRLHLYEGRTVAEVVFPTRVLAELGCETLIVTNAAGGLNPLFWPGDLMAITDHINLPGLAGLNPLFGAEGDAFGDRFVDLKDAYDPDLVELAIRAGRGLGLEVRRGVYVMLPGPNYETPAEVRLLQALGADAVGMSTIPEVLVARQRGLRVLGLSCITNMATGAGGKVSHEQVLARSLSAGPLMASVIREAVSKL